MFVWQVNLEDCPLRHAAPAPATAAAATSAATAATAATATAAATAATVAVPTAATVVVVVLPRFGQRKKFERNCFMNRGT